MKHLLAVCVELYTVNQLLHLEQLVLCRLQFSLLAPTAYYFLEYYCAEHARQLSGIYRLEVFRLFINTAW